MKSLFITTLILLTAGCSERPEDDVCRLNDRLSEFLCATSRVDLKPGHGKLTSFYVSNELGMRAIPNLTGTIARLAGTNNVLFIGGDEGSRIAVVLKAAANDAVQKNLTLDGATIVFIGSSAEDLEVSRHVRGLGANYVFSEKSRP